MQWLGHERVRGCRDASGWPDGTGAVGRADVVAAATVTDVWEAARHKVARLLGRGDPKNRNGRAVDKETHQQLTAAADADLEPIRPRRGRWEARFADLLDEDPGAEADLRAVVEEIAAQLPAGVPSAADHSVAAGRGV